MQEENFKCEECGKECRSLNSLSEYGMRYYKTKDNLERCDKCFSKFEKEIE
jgi:hypothetical protein